MKNYIAIVLFAAISFHTFGQKAYKQSGNASVIGDKFVGRYTANGEKYAHDKLTAAHLTLPFGTRVKVINPENNKTVVVRINDRGPFVEDRIIDLSKSAASQLGFTAGVKKVVIEVVGKEEATAVESASEVPEKTIEKRIAQGAYYKIQSENVVPSGFGIQIASYKEPSNLLRLTESIKIESGYNPIVEIAENENGKTFRLIVGEFKTRKEAEQVKKNLLESYPKCFVVSFD